MAPGTVAFRIKRPPAIVADSAKISCINFVHGDRYGSLLHFREHITVVALFAFDASFLVYCAVERHGPHGALGEFNGFFTRDSEGDAGTQEQDCHDQNG